MIDKGETITLRVEYEDSDGNKTDPTSPVEVTILQPDGTKDGPFTATKDSTGIFKYDYSISSAGIHRYKFTTGDNAIEQDSFVAEDDQTE